MSSYFFGSPIQSTTQLDAQLVARIGELCNCAVMVDELHMRTLYGVPAIEFALFNISRSIVQRGIGELFFSIDSAVTDRGGCNGYSVMLIEVEGWYAVLDVARGYPENDSDEENDAYCTGVAYLYESPNEAWEFASQCTQQDQRSAVSSAFQRALEIGQVIDPTDFVQGLIHATQAVLHCNPRNALTRWCRKLMAQLTRPQSDLCR